jgi:hypothetical protein
MTKKIDDSKLEKGYDLIYINDKGELVMRKGSITPLSEIKRLNEMYPITKDKKNDTKE